MLLQPTATPEITNFYPLQYPKQPKNGYFESPRLQSELEMGVQTIASLRPAKEPFPLLMGQCPSQESMRRRKRGPSTLS